MRYWQRGIDMSIPLRTEPSVSDCVGGHVGSNGAGAATTRDLSERVAALEATATQQDDAVLNTKVNTETSRAQAVEAIILYALGQEGIRAKTIEITLQTEINRIVAYLFPRSNQLRFIGYRRCGR
jgi:hypothetical protein